MNTASFDLNNMPVSVLNDFHAWKKRIQTRDEIPFVSFRLESNEIVIQ